MLLIPAVDLMGQKAVRLVHGKRDQVTVYSEVPWELPAQFAEAGAERVHVVDLDGAFAGDRAQRDAIERLAAASPIPVQLGGGIRSKQAAQSALASGIEAVVIGTAAVTEPAWVQALCATYPDRVVIAVDARDGRVKIRGWVEDTALTATELGERARDWGAAAVLYTDISRDGTGGGVNVEATAQLTELLSPTPVIASGGIGSLDDIRDLVTAGVKQAVMGKALYSGAVDLADALAIAKGEPDAV